MSGMFTGTGLEIEYPAQSRARNSRHSDILHSMLIMRRNMHFYN